jgi:hypothetical protein
MLKEMLVRLELQVLQIQVAEVLEDSILDLLEEVV